VDTATFRSKNARAEKAAERDPRECLSNRADARGKSEAGNTPQDSAGHRQKNFKIAELQKSARGLYANRVAAHVHKCE
jgi:hypothetical protein